MRKPNNVTMTIKQLG